MKKTKRVQGQRKVKRGKKGSTPKKDTRGTYYLVFIVAFLISVVIGLKYFGAEEAEIAEGMDPVKGASNAKVTIVEYSDFECPACGAMYPVLDEIVKRYPDDVRVIYKNFPLSGHKWSYTAALASECAFDSGKFWEFHDILFDRQKGWSKARDAREDFLRYAKKLDIPTDEFNTCIDSKPIKQRVNDDRSSGRKLNINSTPTFFINGKRYVGVWSVSEFERIIKKSMATP